MRIVFGLLGLMVTLAAAITVLKSFLIWKGALRYGMFYFILGFVSFAAGFISKIFLQGSINLDIGLFSFGAIFFLIGTRKLFSFCERERI